MTALPWLDPGDPFPPPETALRDPAGLLAAGNDLSPATLIDAYRQGIFPWYSPGDPILWWTPDPRLVIFPGDFHCSRRLQRRLDSGQFLFSVDHAFDQVIHACASIPRDGQSGTWIVPEMIAAYRHLHRLGHAHSIEVWQDGALAGGIYGICLGRVFFGESMFSRATDGSKAAMATLFALAPALDIRLLDCQVESRHLLSLGARNLSRADFNHVLTTFGTRPRPLDWSHAPAPFADLVNGFTLKGEKE